MFFIKLDIMVTASGTIKAEGDWSTITSPANGRLSMVKLQENSFVSKGDTLFVVRPDNINAQIPALNRRRDELSDFIHDINRLVNGVAGEPTNFRSPVYTQEYLSYVDQVNDYEYNISVAEKNFIREQRLYQAGVTSAHDFEIIEEKYEMSVAALNVYKSKAAAQWQSQKNQYQNELREIETSIDQLNIQRNESVVYSPISGTIQKLENVAEGMYVHAGQKIVDLSPDGKLIAECYVLPQDIGLVRENQECNIQIDAYNYNQWGMLTGRISEIFKDVLHTSDGSRQYAYYSIYCDLDSDKLSLKTGYESPIKKGMTLTCRMIVTRRTVAQLLYDKIDDWLNPNLMD
jgi:HlyD family secretion protein